MPTEEAGWDASTTAAWRAFETALVEVLESTPRDAVIVTVDGLEVGAGAPYVQFFRAAVDVWEIEVSADVFVDEAHRIGDLGGRRLQRLGFDLDTDGRPTTNPWCAVPTRETARAAALAVRALREVYGVAHPFFLGGHQILVPATEPTASGPGELPEPTWEDSTAATFPRGGFAHLQELVDEVAGEFVEEVEHDGDGDIAIPFQGGVLYLRVLENAPTVQLFATLAHFVTDLRTATFEVQRLNREESQVKFELIDDRVFASVHVDAWPFAPEHLRHAILLMHDTLDRVAAPLAVRLGLASMPWEDDESDEDLPDGFDEAPDEADDADDADDADPTGLLLHVLSRMRSHGKQALDARLLVDCVQSRESVLLDLMDAASQTAVVTWRLRSRAIRGEGCGVTAEQAVAWEELAADLRRAHALLVEVPREGAMVELRRRPGRNG